MVEQLSVFLQNKSGKIASITRALADEGVDIRALSIADTSDFGILRMLVSDIAKAKTVLQGHHCMVSANSVVVVAVQDVSGGLAQIMSLLAQEQVDVEYMYSLIGRGKNDAFMVLRVNDEQRLQTLIDKNGLRSVSNTELGIG